MTDTKTPSLVQAFLAHYGVQGMKWGVRKDYERKARQARAEFARVGWNAIAYSQREITESEYASLSSKPIRISEANGEFKRVIKSQDTKLRDGMVYVTKDEQDHTNYIALFAPEGNDANRAKFSATVKTSKAVVSPAMKERVDTFISTLGSKVVDPNSSQVVTGRAYLLGTVEHPQIRALSDREVGLKFYQQWVQGQHTNDVFNQAYVNKLQKKGYNAIIDDADKGMMSQTPIILFPKQSGARITEVVPITKDDELIARASMRAPEQRNQ
jgi:hypothetical protein